jgi:branched-chain amino acid transport system ATP-binding protein
VSSPSRTLSTEKLTVRFGGLLAISSVSVTLISGEIVGLIGPNGAGKTTFVNCLTGFQAPTEGRILFDGQDTAGWDAPRYRSAGVSRTFQAGRLFKDMTVLENVEVVGVGLGLSRREAQAAGLQMLNWLGMEHTAPLSAGTLPYTDERRVGIARALMMRPAFILLDEPAAGMSEPECEELMRVVKEMPATFGCGVLLIEHNMSVVMGVCDRIHVLDGGKTLASGRPEDVAKDPAVLTAYLGEDV